MSPVLTRTYEFTSFDPLIEEEEEQLPLVPEITQEDVENARRSGIQLGVQQGFEAGEKKAREELEKAFAKAAEENDEAVEKLFHQLAEQFDILIKQQQVLMEQSSEMMLRMTTRVWQKLMPQYVAAYGTQEIETVIRASLELMRKGSVLKLEFSQSNADAMVKILRPLQNIYQDSLDFSLHPTSELGGTDVRMIWDGGSVHRSMDDLLQQLETIVQEAIEQFHAQQVKDQAALV